MSEDPPDLDFFNCYTLFSSLKDLKNHNRSNLITFQKIGLGGRNGINSKGWKMKTLSQHLIDEGHTKVRQLLINCNYWIVFLVC